MLAATAQVDARPGTAPTRGPGLPRRGSRAPGSGGFEMVKIDSCPHTVHSKMNKAEKKKATKNEAEKPVVAASSAPVASDAAPAATLQAALEASVEEQDALQVP